jgi:hypothetical protein
MVKIASKNQIVIYLLPLAILVILIISCNAEQKLRSDIRKHGSLIIQEYGIGKVEQIEVQRSKIDSLDKGAVNKLNAKISEFNSNYPSEADFVFINYYPGRDRCNSSGIATRNSIGKSNLRLKRAIKRRNNIVNINFYKDSVGLYRYSKNQEWVEDPNDIIENTFFKYHFPCSSYLILHRSGKYYVYYGENYLEKKLKDLKLFPRMINQN